MYGANGKAERVPDSVWVVLPSARPVAEVNARMSKWRGMGYFVALWRDDKYAPPGAFAIRTQDMGIGLECDLLFIAATYPGYAVTVNTMARHILDKDPACDWIVATGDDTDPDPTKRADEIARECSEYFRDRMNRLSNEKCLGIHPLTVIAKYDTFGVMQPTGDPWRDTQGRIIERIAGSPWLGREWCRRINQGAGPLWPEYTHCFADEELQNVAIKLGVFWQRPDLTHHHENWARKRHDRADMPAFLTEANSPEHWAKYSKLFAERKAAGFPGHEPIL